MRSATCRSSKTPRTCSSSSSPPATNTPPWSSPATCRSPAGEACSATKPSPPRDRPHRPPRRRTHPQRGQLPTPRTRHRQPAQHPHHHQPGRVLDSRQPFTFQAPKLSSFGAPPTVGNSCGLGDRASSRIAHTERLRARRSQPQVHEAMAPESSSTARGVTHLALVRRLRGSQIWMLDECSVRAAAQRRERSPGTAGTPATDRRS
jgi:hypothetical protein